MTDLTGPSPQTIERLAPSDRHREPLGRLRAGIGPQSPQGSENLRLPQSVLGNGNGLLNRPGGPRPGAIPFLAR